LGLFKTQRFEKLFQEPESRPTDEKEEDEEEEEEEEPNGFVRRPRAFLSHEHLRATQPPDVQVWRSCFSYFQVTGTSICFTGEALEAMKEEETEGIQWKQSETKHLEPTTAKEHDMKLLICGTKGVLHEPFKKKQTEEEEILVRWVL
jgi:hypothetical protein